MLAAMRCPLEVASSCMWLPAPAASDSGIEISCCSPLPTDTGMRRCWTGMAADPGDPLEVDVDADGGPLVPVASRT